MIIEYYTCFTAQAFVANPAAFGPALPIFQSLTGTLGTIQSTNDVNTKASPFRDLAAGPRPLYVWCSVGTAFAGVGNQGVTVNLMQSANPAAGPYTLVENLGIFPALATPPVTLMGPQTAVLVDNIQPYAISQQYLSIQFVVGGAALTSGTAAAFITPDPAIAYNYPSNYTVATK